MLRQNEMFRYYRSFILREEISLLNSIFSSVFVNLYMPLIKGSML
nr:ALPV-156 [Albatrosspox virus]